MDNNHPLWANVFRKKDAKQEEINDLWMETALFRNIPHRHIQPITKSLSTRHYDPNETIFREGEIGMGAALIINGKVAIQSSGVRLATLQRGDLFGEIALATDETRTASATALEATDLVFFMKQDLQDLKKQDPGTAAQFTMNLAQLMAVRLRHANNLIDTAPDETTDDQP